MKEFQIFCDDHTFRGRLSDLLIQYRIDQATVSEGVYHLRGTSDNPMTLIPLKVVRFLVPDESAEQIFNAFKTASRQGPKRHQFAVTVQPLERYCMPEF